MSNLEWLPYGRQDITTIDEESVLQCLRSNFLTQGPAVEEFESSLANKCESDHAIAFNSATSALHAACVALHLKPGDRLWTSPISFVASANCGLYCGALVEFVDIDPETGLISISELKRKLMRAEEKGALPKILVPVHLAGTSCRMKEIKELSIKYGFHVVEDASHAVGAKYAGRSVGCSEYSDVTIFSFHPVKIITTGEGGAALSQNSELAIRIKRIRSHGIERENFEFKSPGPWYYEQQMLGYNYRMTDIQASLGKSQLSRLPEIINRRQALANNYRSMLKSLPITLLKEPADCRSSYHLGIIKLEDASAEDHLEIFKGMRASNIGVQLHYWPIHLQPYYQKLGFRKGQYPNAEKYAASCFSIPLFPSMKDEDQTRVLQALKNQLELRQLI